MKKIGLVGGAIVGLLTIASSNLRAETHFPSLDVENLNVTLTAFIQGDTADITRGGDVIGERTLRPMRVKINNKAILEQLNAPTGSKVVLINGDAIGYQNGSALPVSSGFGLDVTPGEVVIVQGRETEVSNTNTDTFKSSFTAQYVAGISIESVIEAAGGVSSNDLSFSMTGLAKEKATSSEVETEDHFKTSDSHSFSLTAAGDGTIILDDEELDALFSGKLKSSGKESDVED